MARQERREFGLDVVYETASPACATSAGTGGRRTASAASSGGDSLLLDRAMFATGGTVPTRKAAGRCTASRRRPATFAALRRGARGHSDTGACYHAPAGRFGQVDAPGTVERGCQVPILELDVDNRRAAADPATPLHGVRAPPRGRSSGPQTEPSGQSMAGCAAHR